MKLNEMCSKLELEPLITFDTEREVEGIYCGDLLSWVMTRLSSNFAWITIMSNINSIAVASLCDATCIVFTENADVPDEVIKKAQEQGINIFKTTKSTFEISYQMGNLLYAK